MITLYTWGTPNGRKISIALEELGLAYDVKTVDIGADEQFSPEFLAISPNNKIPALVDTDGPGGKPIGVFESGAILIYLAEKTGKLLPKDGAARFEVLQWLMFQMGGFGPFLGQAHHFNRFAPEAVPYAQKRYNDEAQRLYGVLDAALAGRDFVAGEFSIADIALYPWAARHEWQNVKLADFPNVQRWFDALSARPAFQKGMAVPA
ncbi:glutathione S-transferase family protein [Crenobacter cavernae]|uniref:Glutathione S-transferase family protein n=1 Tax=Crenobacter cavernae TaxID=2290923 RepID=A0A345Y5P7_9NEIS|nr:glutathione S-transferase N-terminal domain-containing protein [Crenobacter cavernae]AXK39249.1 glutathione S-transferase family protein [Crenobacter cavernae]